jgi:triphosphatase
VLLTVLCEGQAATVLQLPAQPSTAAEANAQKKTIMGTETELKFEVAPQDLRKLKAAPALHRKPAKEENLISVYFDTPKHKLARNGVSLRVRHNGDKRLQTVKFEGIDGSFRRGEWECEIKGNVPNLRTAPGTALAPLLTKKLRRRLKPIFATRVHRTSIPVSKNRSRIEVALDEGQVRAGRLSASISELELELKRGKAVTCSSWRANWQSLCPSN